MGQAVGRAISISDWVFPEFPASYDASHKLLVHLPSEVGVEIPAMLVAPLAPRHELGFMATSCVIYFHANACDIGQCVEDMLTFRDGALDGDAVVLCPEYPGYGLLCAYEPSVSGINKIAQAAWRYCLEELGFSAEQVMLFGRSIGTGPATALAHSVALRGAEARPVERGSNADRAALCTGPGSEPQLQAARSLGGLVLLAPFTSIKAVVEHHVPSRVLASLVGPMWEVLELVTDASMVDVPLCVIHPKDDKVVPSSQGQAVFEGARCRAKLGVWLCNAGHNLWLTEEQLGLTRRFLQRLTRHARRARRRRPGARDSSQGAVPVASEAEECWAVADELMQLGAAQRVEEQIWMSL